ncbi:uncharacterized protein M421DRAFT_417491 [Didymella exigua CBS 183.55]|uniref:DUF7730 domain-containing protein n=1 Tax=Didymella exigua CBS 183.55 TaxID=1150837 RepID=A0A6A5RVW1_9PLEO|nr:uncharacterized protein M421DRAFT_417491 [Didymella exigua CBS 183.55]KAF1931729.1 hypothetical protein M421DRAFT_417491 [Didymella exigua CBS 183.55]
MDATSMIVGKLRLICEYVGVLNPRHYRSFRFLDLPVEIRLLIYKELFGGARAHMVGNWEQNVPTQSIGCEPDDPRRKERIQGQLFHLDHDNTSCRFHSTVLRSCKTVYDEALPVLYANPVFNISTFAGEKGTLPLVNVTHIRRIMTRAWQEVSMKEQEIAEGYRLAGVQWDKLWLFAIDMGHGLGSGIARPLPDGSPDSVVRAISGRATPIEYDASDVDWLFKLSSASELKKLGVCFRPFPECWYAVEDAKKLRCSRFTAVHYKLPLGDQLNHCDPRYLDIQAAATEPLKDLVSFTL